MASKRAQILEQALHLFNEKGVGETSTHDIARAAGVAQGNLTYHFPKRPDLVEALYFELIEELDELFKRLGPGDLSFKALFDAQLGQARLQKKYRFLFLDFGRVSAPCPYKIVLIKKKRVLIFWENILSKRHEG